MKLLYLIPLIFLLQTGYCQDDLSWMVGHEVVYLTVSDAPSYHDWKEHTGVVDKVYYQFVHIAKVDLHSWPVSCYEGDIWINSCFVHSIKGVP